MKEKDPHNLPRGAEGGNQDVQTSEIYFDIMLIFDYPEIEPHNVPFSVPGMRLSCKFIRLYPLYCYNL